MRRVVLLALAAPLVLAGAIQAAGAAWLWSQNWGVVRVLNLREEALTTATITVDGRGFALPRLGPGEEAQLFVKAGPGRRLRLDAVAGGHRLCGQGRTPLAPAFEWIVGVAPEGVYFGEPAAIRTGCAD